MVSREIFVFWCVSFQLPKNFLRIRTSILELFIRWGIKFYSKLWKRFIRLMRLSIKIVFLFQWQLFLYTYSSTPLSSTQMGHSFSAPKVRQSNTKNSVQHTRQFHTKNPQVQHLLLLLKWRVCWTEVCVKLRGILNWRIFGVELTDFGCWKSVVRVLKWSIELRGTPKNHWEEDFFLLVSKL